MRSHSKIIDIKLPSSRAREKFNLDTVQHCPPSPKRGEDGGTEQPSDDEIAANQSSPTTLAHSVEKSKINMDRRKSKPTSLNKPVTPRQI